MGDFTFTAGPILGQTTMFRALDTSVFSDTISLTNSDSVPVPIPLGHRYKHRGIFSFPTVDGPHASNGPVDMPVLWTKRWGSGRVYYNALGHSARVLGQEPVATLLRRGLLWAAR